MPVRISVPGPTLIFQTTGYVPDYPPSADVFEFIGISQDGVNVAFQNVAVEVPSDSAGTIIPHDYAYGGTQAFIDCTLRIVSHDINHKNDALLGPYLTELSAYRIGFPIIHKRAYGLLVLSVYAKLDPSVSHVARPIYFPRTYVRSVDPYTTSASGISLRVTWRALPLLYFDTEGNLNAPLYDRTLPRLDISQLIANALGSDKDWQLGFYNSSGGQDGDRGGDGYGDGGYE
jgi:hypothetical protein